MNKLSTAEEAIFSEALDLPAGARGAFVGKKCSHDPALAGLVMALLRGYEENSSYLEKPPDSGLPVGSPGTATDLPREHAAGDRIGHYHLIERIGEGGCGVVYLAEQQEPVRRFVALKVIKLGMDTREFIARFDTERQALALMDHANIARVFDAGATGPGRPYLVMELVRGLPITRYCDENQLPTEQRLKLFVTVCHAIQHAHQKGIIHRDLKPSNILVTLQDGEPVPKVIDFGIAKALHAPLTEKTLLTGIYAFLGTPAYTSPEQIEMGNLDVDTRSDIYSLGALLYELLTGHTPFDGQELTRGSLDAMRKTIRETEPPRPSMRLGATAEGELKGIAERRGIAPPRLVHRIRGDLDWIVMKCLEKDRIRRYETANGLAADLNRHLHDEPVATRPPSSAYRFQKFVGRNKLAFVAGIAVAAALLLGTVASTWQAVRATRAKREALAAQAREAGQREKAEAGELTARQRAFASDMNVAAQAINGNNLGQALDLLNRQRPRRGQTDLRGWEWRYLWQQTRSDSLFTLSVDSAEINSLAASPDGHWLAVGAFHRSGVSVWDVRTRQEVIRFSKNEERALVAFSPTEPLLAFTSVAFTAAGKEQGALRLWNAAARQIVAELPLDAVCVGLAFARDGRTLVTSTTGGEITLWRMPEGTKLVSFPSEQSVIGPGTDFAATTDLSLAAYAYGTANSPRVRVMDVRNGRELWTAVAGKIFVTALAFSPDGKTLATAAGFHESAVRLWDVATGREIGQLEGHGSWVSSLVFWPDGKKLASGSADQTIRIWDVPARKCLDVLSGHRHEVWRLSLLPDAKTLVSGAKDGTVNFWDTSSTHPRQRGITIPENVFTWCFTPDGRSILSLEQEGKVSRWTGSDFQQKESVLEMRAPAPSRWLSSPPRWPSNLFSQDGRLLAVGSTNGVLQIWDVSRQILLRQWTNTTGPVAPVTFLANGSKLITASESDLSFHEWDSTTGLEVQKSWRQPEKFRRAIGFSPDERSSLAVGFEGSVVLRSLVDESQTKVTLDVLEGACASYSPDGKLFTVGTNLGFARVWDTATWREQATVGAFFGGARSVAFSPDGKRLAIGRGGNESVKLYDTKSWQEVFTLEGQDHDSGKLAFSPDGNAIGRLSDTGVLHIWRAPSWEEIARAEAEDNKSKTR